MTVTRIRYVLTKNTKYWNKNLFRLPKQSKNFKAATKSLNSSFKSSVSKSMMASKSEDAGTNEDSKEILAEAICDIFSQAIKIPLLVAETGDNKDEENVVSCRNRNMV